MKVVSLTRDVTDGDRIRARHIRDVEQRIAIVDSESGVLTELLDEVDKKWVETILEQWSGVTIDLQRRESAPRDYLTVDGSIDHAQTFEGAD